jgi:hypothetical protein
MAIVIDDGWAQEDDPIFSDSWTVFSVRKSNPSTKSGEPEKPVKESPSEQSAKPEEK